MTEKLNKYVNSKNYNPVDMYKSLTEVKTAAEKYIKAKGKQIRLGTKFGETRLRMAKDLVQMCDVSLKRVKPMTKFELELNNTSLQLLSTTMKAKNLSFQQVNDRI